MSDPLLFPPLFFLFPQVLRAELAPVELDFGQLYFLLLEDCLDRWSKVQPLLFMAILYLGYVFQFMFFDLAKMDIVYFDFGFDDVIKHMYFPLQWNKVFKFSSTVYICLVVKFLFYTHLKRSIEVNAFPLWVTLMYMGCYGNEQVGGIRQIP